LCSFPAQPLSISSASSFLVVSELG
jgi:hypothetical protein